MASALYRQTNRIPAGNSKLNFAWSPIANRPTPTTWPYRPPWTSTSPSSSTSRPDSPRPESSACPDGVLDLNRAPKINEPNSKDCVNDLLTYSQLESDSLRVDLNDFAAELAEFGAFAVAVGTSESRARAAAAALPAAAEASAALFAVRAIRRLRRRAAGNGCARDRGTAALDRSSSGSR